MAPWQDRHNIRLQKYDYSTPGAYFLTLCVKNRKCVLSHIVGTGVLDGPSIELLPYGKIADKYINQLNDYYDNLSVESYVIMPDHIHILLHVLEGPLRTPPLQYRILLFPDLFQRLRDFVIKNMAKIFGNHALMIM